MKVIDWDKMSGPWLKAEPVLEQVHQAVLDGVMARAGLTPGQRVLDVGCGTGASLLAAARSVGDTGHVTGVDIAPPLVARARERAPAHVDVVVGDAGSLAFEQPFDAAISLFGTMFFQDTQAAFASLRKALLPGSRFVFAAWGAPPRNPWFGIPRQAVEAHVGALPKPDSSAPGPFRFADAGAVAELIESVGWTVKVETVALDLHTERDAGALADMQVMLAERLMLSDRDITDADRAAIRANLVAGFGGADAGSNIKVPAEVHYFTATASG